MLILILSSTLMCDAMPETNAPIQTDAPMKCKYNVFQSNAPYARFAPSPLSLFSLLGGSLSIFLSFYNRENFKNTLQISGIYRFT